MKEKKCLQQQQNKKKKGKPRIKKILNRTEQMWQQKTQTKHTIECSLPHEKNKQTKKQILPHCIVAIVDIFFFFFTRMITKLCYKNISYL